MFEDFFFERGGVTQELQQSEVAFSDYRNFCELIRHALSDSVSKVTDERDQTHIVAEFNSNATGKGQTLRWFPDTLSPKSVS